MELTPALPQSAEQRREWVPPRELAEQRRGVIPRRGGAGARPCGVRALNARTRVRGQVRAGGWAMRVWVPPREADPARGGA
jgi:hypothetical protein